MTEVVEQTEELGSPTSLVTGVEETTEENTEVQSTENTDGTTDGKSETDAPVELEFTVPEGLEVNEPLMTEFKALAKELGISQEVGQKLIDLQSNYEMKRAEEAQESWDTLQKEWVDKATADKEYGGQALKSNLAIAKKTIEQFGTPELKEMLDFTGAGNHPEIIRLFYRIGKAISEDNLVMGGNPTAPAERDAAKTLYPNHN